MEFPREVSDHLQRAFEKTARPICLLTNAEGVIQQVWGETEWCNLPGLLPGVDLLDAAPFLFGLLGREPATVDQLAVSGAVLTVHTIPTGSRGHYVALLDASEHHDSIRARQQTVNELRLLHASQQNLIARQKDLIGELVEARAELDHIRKDAERNSESKGRFIAMMSHEFRTPLASIINYAELAREANATENDVRRSIETITRSARHLTALIEAVLDEAQLDAGRMEVSESKFDLHEMLEELSAMMAPLAADKELAFVSLIDSAVPKFVRADDVKLRQILINLVGNAIKYTSDGGITVTTTYVEGRLVSSVADTGPGISDEDQERIFRAFERGSTPNRDSGAGLGLTISLRLAQLMGGEISLDSRLGQGCTVAVNLPVIVAEDPPGSEALAAPREESYADHSVSVLVCDDDEDMLALVEFYLHRAGYGLMTSSNGPDALSKALQYEPDMIVMDCNLPGMSGVECARILRKEGYSKPIVALTASKLSDDDRRPFTTCVEKGTSMHTLLAEIKSQTH